MAADAAAVGAGVERDPGLVRRHDRVAAAHVQVGHRRGVGGELRAPGCGVLGELVESASPSAPARPRARPSPRPGRSCRPVPCSMQSMPASISPASTSGPKQCAVTFAPCSWAAAIAAANASGGNDGVRSPVVAGDPVADQLDPAVAALRLLGDVRRQVVGLDLVGVVADVAPGAGDVPAGPDQPRQVVAVVDPAGVGGRAAVAEQQRAARRGPRSPAARWPRRDRAVVVETEVAVGVDQPGTIQPSTARSAPGTRLVGDPAVDDVQLARLAVGQDRAGEPERSSSHAPDASRDGRRRTSSELVEQPGRAERQRADALRPGPGGSGRRSPP